MHLRVVSCLVFLAAFGLGVLRAAEAPASPPADAAAAAFEQQVAAVVAGPQVTVVHFWAPWCPNCRAEMTPDGWAKFIGENSEVKFVFVNVWHRGQDPAPKLAAGKLGAQPNLQLLTHPVASSRTGEKLAQFLGLPLTWIPTTWVFRDGKLRFAFNYGEIRFPMLQQAITDSRDAWKH